MHHRLTRLATVSILIIGAQNAHALPFNSFDPRSMAMGGAGVAVGDAAMAPFFNPALLAVARDGDNFSLNLPVVGIRVYDPDNFHKSLDDFQDGNYVDNLDNSITAYNTAKSTANIRAIASNTSLLSDQLKTLDNKPVQCETGAAMVIGIPGKRFGSAFFVDGWGAAGGIAHYSDDATLQEFATVLNNVADCYDANMAVPGSCNPAAVPNVTKYFDARGNITYSSSNLTSTVDLHAIGIAETGLALATQFGEGHRSWALGITPKYQRVRLYEYTADVNNADINKFNSGDYLAEYSHTNLDIGMAKNYENGWRSGLVVKNVISHTYAYKNVPRDPLTDIPIPGAEPVPTGSTISLKPQARLGVSHQNDWSTLALDVDLTANAPAGLENRSRYIALGAELDGARWIQLRAGYRVNVLDSKRNVVSGGLGFALFGSLHIDAAVAGNHDEVGAALQLGLLL